MSATALPILANARIASPCSADWNDMTGDERVRFCGCCEKNVYNLTDLPTENAEAIILKHEGNLCVRLYQRADGTLISEDCPRGLAAARRTLRRGLAVMTSAFAALLIPILARGIGINSGNSVTLTRLDPFKWLNNRVNRSTFVIPVQRSTLTIKGRIHVTGMNPANHNELSEEDDNE